jgi:prepilin-type N-terminal cleavage/methylation domain
MAKNLGRAFTLFELMIVILVIAILASIAYPIFIDTQERAKVAKDMNNLRQIGIATQLYMNDKDGALPGSATATWMSQLCPKYTAAWGIFKSPLDTTRLPSEAGTGSPASPISYGINSKIYDVNNVAISADKIAKPTVFILFAPAQDNATTVNFQGLATTPAPGVTVLGNSNTVTSNPASGAATGGTQNNRTRINALFADLHCENMLWSAFTNTTATPPTDPDQWTPYTPYP